MHTYVSLYVSESKKILYLRLYLYIFLCMCLCMRALCEYTHMSMYRHLINSQFFHTCALTHIHHTHTRTNTQIQARTRTRTHTHTNAHTSTHTLTCTHTHTHIHTHTHTHTHTHAHTHTYTHTHIQTNDTGASSPDRNPHSEVRSGSCLFFAFFPGSLFSSFPCFLVHLLRVFLLERQKLHVYIFRIYDRPL